VACLRSMCPGSAGPVRDCTGPGVRSRNNRVFLSYACGTAKANHACLASATLNVRRLTDVEEIFLSRRPKSGLRRTTRWAHCVYAGQHPVLSLGDGFNYVKSRRDPPAISALIRSPESRTARRLEDNPLRGAGRRSSRALQAIGHRNVQADITTTEGQRFLGSRNMARVVGMRSTW